MKAMRHFSQVIDKLELKDLSYLGGCFTWRGGTNNTRNAILDRFLISNDRDCLFGGASQEILPCPTSDHFQVALEGSRGAPQGLLPFRFTNMSLKEEGFKELVKAWWQQFDFSCTGNYILVEKLKALKSKLKEWNGTMFGKVDENKKAPFKTITHWDNLQSQRTLTPQELEQQLEAINDFKKWAISEVTSWCQKSREFG